MSSAAHTELLAIASRIHGYMRQLVDEQEMYYEDIASELGGEEELQIALLATAIVEKLIEPKPAMMSILQEIEEKLLEIVEA
jgi:hypothetical protein